MSEPAGVMFKMNISENALKKFLKSKQVATENFIDAGTTEYKTNPKYKVDQLMAAFLHSCINQSGNVFLFHYNIVKQELFFAYVLNYEWWSAANAVLSTLRQMSQFQDLPGDSFALCFSPISLDVYDAFLLDNGKSTSIKQNIPGHLVPAYTESFWSYFDKKAATFLEPIKAIRKKNYYYKSIIKAYKSYLKVVEVEEKPKKIRMATANKPFHLFDFIYTWEGKVYDCLYGFNTPIELPYADPYTLTKVGKVYADKNSVYKKNPLEGSYFIVEGIDSASFQIVGGNSYDYLYTKDKSHIYLDTKKIPSADVKSFEQLDYGNGKDKNHVYYRDEVIPISPTEFKIDRHGFIRDEKHIFHYGRKIEMDAITFTVRKYESETNPFTGVFELADKNGTYKYDSVNKTFTKL